MDLFIAHVVDPPTANALQFCSTWSLKRLKKSARMTELKDFEKKIVEKWKGTAEEPWKFGPGAVSPKSYWIRGYLLEHGEGYTQLMWTRWQSFVAMARGSGTKIRAGSLESFRLYMWILKKLRLIIPSRKEQNPRKSFHHRQYFRLDKTRLSSPVWKNPFGNVYPRSLHKVRKNMKKASRR